MARSNFIISKFSKQTSPHQTDKQNLKLIFLYFCL
eukprot:UN03873